MVIPMNVMNNAAKMAGMLIHLNILRLVEIRKLYIYIDG